LYEILIEFDNTGIWNTGDWEEPKYPNIYIYINIKHTHIYMYEGVSKRFRTESITR